MSKSLRRICILLTLLYFSRLDIMLGQKNQRFQISQGVGVSKIGVYYKHLPFFVSHISLETEICTLIYPWLELSYSLRYLLRYPHQYKTRYITFVQPNFGIYALLFRNRPLGLNIGTGFSVFNLLNSENVNNAISYANHQTSVGFMIMVEPRLNIYKHFVVRINLNLQLYQNTVISYGVIAKLAHNI